MIALVRTPPMAWVAATLTVLAVILGVTSQAQAAFPGANGRIAFETSRAGNGKPRVPAQAGRKDRARPRAA